MTIASELLKLQNNLDNSYTACQNKGATLPASQNFDNLASTISAIPAGTTPTLASLTVTPSTTAQTLTPPSGTDGYNTVTVSAVTASIDGDIQAGNIKSGVSILGVTGTYEGSGGGGSKYGATGGTFLGDVDANGVLSYDSSYPTDLVFTGVRDLGDYALHHRFQYTTSTGNIPQASFIGLSSIETVSFPDLENITGTHAMNYAFSKCGNLSSIYLSDLTTVSNSYAMAYAFDGCTGLTGALDLSSLTTVSGSSAMRYAFRDCSRLTSVDLSSLTTVSNSYAMQYAFYNCTGLTSVDLSSLTTVSGSSAMQYIFRNCTLLTTLSFPSLNSNSFGENTNQFNNMLLSVTGCTVHFPSNLQSVIGSWSSVTSGFGGTNTTVLFDLPATT